MIPCGFYAAARPDIEQLLSVLSGDAELGDVVLKDKRRTSKVV